MRIIAGTAGGTLLASPKGPLIRPSPDKVKQAIFSSLGERLVGARVLDLFAGTGALGLEAASRGAQSVVLVDDSRFCIETAKANAAKARLDESVRIERGDAFRVLDAMAQRGEQFDLIFADPPYEKRQRPQASAVRKLLNCPALVSILAPDGMLVVEHFKSDPAEPTTAWELDRQLRHGDTMVSLFKNVSRTTTRTSTENQP
jgi:16S rRNA (guanine(966)-N(2))-methyltransferase RsmD